MIDIRIDSEISSNNLSEYLRKVLSEYYTIGDLIRLKRNKRGYINVSYEIEVVKNKETRKYLLRFYEIGASEEKIKYEHALLNELHKRRFEFSPNIISTKEGKTYIMHEIPSKNRSEVYFIAIFNYLSGSDKYTWNGPFCTTEELKDAANVLALYHNIIFDWRVINSWIPPRFIQKIPSVMTQWEMYVKNIGDSQFDTYFLQQYKNIINVFKIFTKASLKKIYSEMPFLAIHGDYHPGNLKFEQEKITGVFDLDWSTLDARFFDVGLAIVYFCADWSTHDGSLLIERAITFLRAYQEAAKKMEGIGPLSANELQYLPEMIHLGNLYLLDWIVGDFYKKNTDPHEYLIYLRHSVDLIRWIENNMERLALCFAKI